MSNFKLNGDTGRSLKYFCDCFAMLSISAQPILNWHCWFDKKIIVLSTLWGNSPCIDCTIRINIDLFGRRRSSADELGSKQTHLPPSSLFITCTFHKVVNHCINNLLLNFSWQGQLSLKPLCSPQEIISFFVMETKHLLYSLYVKAEQIMGFQTFFSLN